MRVCLTAALFVCATLLHADDFQPARCEVIPLPQQQVSFRIDGVEKLRWHAGAQAPRPFFFPFNGPSGVSLTRMGHPGAPNHDHHRSVWFAHHKLNGIDFWSDNTAARVRQKQWLCYEDGDEQCVMAVRLGWYDEQGTELMEQDVVAALMPLDDVEHVLELQLTCRPGANQRSVTLEQTNFGLLAIRVSKTVSAFFGGGQISCSEGRRGENQIFGKQARWMDYSGPVVVGTGSDRTVVTEGITCFDHPDNPRYPTHWHVRKDGWMGASFGMQEPCTIAADESLTLRYQLHAHSGPYDPQKAEAVHQDFRDRPSFVLRKATRAEAHRHFIVERRPASSQN